MVRKMTKEQNYDVVIAGCGVAGLYTALSLPRDMKILMLSKEDIASCDSMLAQGGICVLRDENDYDAYFEDTMRAGHYEFLCHLSNHALSPGFPIRLSSELRSRRYHYRASSSIRVSVRFAASSACPLSIFTS